MGVGVGEDTAALFYEGRIQVMGTGTVMIYDARGATIHPGSPQAASGLSVQVLRGGMSWQLKAPVAPLGMHEHLPRP